MKIKVRSKWQGMVGIRDKYVSECLRMKDPMEIHCEGEVMVIGPDEVGIRQKGKSDRQFRDKFSSESHYLIYFDWKCDQGKLF